MTDLEVKLTEATEPVTYLIIVMSTLKSGLLKRLEPVTDFEVIRNLMPMPTEIRLING